MKTLINVLDQATINMAHTEMEHLRKDQRWGVSLNGWPSGLYENAHIGSVSHTLVSPELKQRVINTLAPYIPRCDSIWVQHYLWHPLSGITLHNDQHQVFGATIYLTPEWNINWGGLFIYTPTTSMDDLKVIYPTFNSAVINNEKMSHAVTTVSPVAPYSRYTLQIWGLD